MSEREQAARDPDPELTALVVAARRRRARRALFVLILLAVLNVVAVTAWVMQ